MIDNRSTCVQGTAVFTGDDVATSLQRFQQENPQLAASATLKAARSHLAYVATVEAPNLQTSVSAAQRAVENLQTAAEGRAIHDDLRLSEEALVRALQQITRLRTSE